MVFNENRKETSLVFQVWIVNQVWIV